MVVVVVVVVVAKLYFYILIFYRSLRLFNHFQECVDNAFSLCTKYASHPLGDLTYSTLGQFRNGKTFLLPVIGKFYYQL